jgi:hypothetical protein
MVLIFAPEDRLTVLTVLTTLLTYKPLPRIFHRYLATIVS